MVVITIRLNPLPVELQSVPPFDTEDIFHEENQYNDSNYWMLHLLSVTKLMSHSRFALHP